MTEGTFDLAKEIARISRAQEDLRTFVDEQHRLAAESRKRSQMSELALLQVALGSMAMGAGLVAATIMAFKLF